MRIQKAILVGIIFLLIVSLTLSFGYAKETETEVPTGTPTEPKTVNFLYENLKAAIKEYLNKALGEEIILAEQDTFTSFEVRGRGITNLTGIQHCFNLTELYIGKNQISNISVLSSLTSLVILF